jgi:hypothetical protein
LEADYELLTWILCRLRIGLHYRRPQGAAALGVSTLTVARAAVHRVSGSVDIEDDGRALGMGMVVLRRPI